MSHRCHSVLADRNGRKTADVVGLSADFTHGHTIAEHSHPEDQFLFASTGVMTLSTRHGVWVVPALRAVWIPAHIPHSLVMSGAVSMRTLYLSPKLSRSRPQKCVVIGVSSLLKELVLHACTFPRLSRRIPTQKRIIEIVLDQLKVVESIPLQLQQPVDPRAMRVAKALLANPGTQRSLDQLCRHCGASKRTVQRIFFEETKLTFGKWRQQLCLLHAMRCLAAGGKVSNAALEAGYSSPSAFISMFRKQLGTTPARYLHDRNQKK